MMFDSAKVDFKLVDPTIAEDTQTKTQSTDSALSDVDNLVNLTNKKRPMYLEKKYFKLDGSHSFCEAGTDDVGWESAGMSNDTGAASGQIITLEGTVAGKKVPITEIDGSLSSVVNPIIIRSCGKNLFNLTEWTGTATQITNGIRVSGTGGYTNAYLRFSKLPSGTYRLGADILQTGTQTSVEISPRPYGADTPYYGIYTTTIISGRVSLTFTIPAGSSGTKIYFYSNSSGIIRTTSCDFTNIQIEFGNIASAYEIYTGTDFSVPIKDVNNITYSLGVADKIIYTNNGWQIYYNGAYYNSHSDLISAMQSIVSVNDLTNIFSTNTVLPTLVCTDVLEWLNFAFNATHDSYGLTISFPPNSYPKDFQIIYSASGTVLHTTTVTDNLEYNYRDTTDVLGWDNIRISMTALNNRGQRARVWSVVFGITEEWNGNNLIKITASKSTDLAASNVPSGEVEFSVYNSGDFDIQSIKDLSSEVQRNIEIDVSFRRNNAYVKFGTYRSADMTVKDLGKKITISGYDAFYPLGNTYFEIGSVPSAPQSLYELAQEVSADCGLDNLVIDSSLEDIYTTGYISYVPHREALRLIAEAGNCILTVDSDGIPHIAPLSSTTFGELTNDDIVDGTEDISNADRIDGIILQRYTYSQASTPIGLSEIHDILLTGSEQTLWIDFASYPAVVTVSDLASSANITFDTVKTKCYSDRVMVVFTGTALETGWITVVGYPYNVSSVSSELGNTSGANVKIIQNPLITLSTVAASVLAYQWDRAENIYKYSGDVYVESDIGLGQEVEIDDNPVYVTKIERYIDAEGCRETLEGCDA